MILVDKHIKANVKRGNIGIDPYDPNLVGPSSYDFHLGSNFMIFNNQIESIDPKKTTNLMKHVVLPDWAKFFILHPGQFALAQSIERFTLADNLVGQVNGKSSLGRLGLQVHATAGFFDPGWDGVATLELSNVAPIPIRLYPGMLIAQMIFMFGSDRADRPYGSPSLNSKYKGSESVTPSRYGENYQEDTFLPKEQFSGKNYQQDTTDTNREEITEANDWVDYLLRESPAVRFWLYPIEIPNEIHDSTSYFRKVLSPLMERARETAPFDKEQPLVFCKMADNAHPPGIHIEGAHR